MYQGQIVPTFEHIYVSIAIGNSLEGNSNEPIGRKVTILMFVMLFWFDSLKTRGHNWSRAEMASFIMFISRWGRWQQWWRFCRLQPWRLWWRKLWQT